MGRGQAESGVQKFSAGGQAGRLVGSLGEGEAMLDLGKLLLRSKETRGEAKVLFEEALREGNVSEDSREELAALIAKC